jgi:hypothetical protein
MKTYRVQYKDTKGLVFSVSEIKATSKTEAVFKAGVEHGKSSFHDVRVSSVQAELCLILKTRNATNGASERTDQDQ